jgi:hypothetical protein
VLASSPYQLLMPMEAWCNQRMDGPAQDARLMHHEREMMRMHAEASRERRQQHGLGAPLLGEAPHIMVRCGNRGTCGKILSESRW